MAKIIKPPTKASLIELFEVLKTLINEAIEDEILLGMLSGLPYWFKSIMAFMNKGMSKSKNASIALINGPRPILRILCLYDSDTFLIITIYNII